MKDYLYKAIGRREYAERFAEEINRYFGPEPRFVCSPREKPSDFLSGGDRFTCKYNMSENEFSGCFFYTWPTEIRGKSLYYMVSGCEDAEYPEKVIPDSDIFSIGNNEVWIDGRSATCDQLVDNILEKFC